MIIGGRFIQRGVASFERGGMYGGREYAVVQTDELKIYKSINRLKVGGLCARKF